MSLSVNQTRLYLSDVNTGSRCAWIISYTPVASEPRVLRQANALLEAGWRIVVAGYEGHSAIPSGWNFVRIYKDKKRYGKVRRLLLAVQYVIGVSVCKIAILDVLRKLGVWLYTLSLPNWRDHYYSVMDIAKNNPGLRADLVIANDYFTCMLGSDLAAMFNAKFVVDAHEYSREQYMHDRKWLVWHRPYVITSQDYFLSRADVVTTVCNGIADLLNAEQKLRRPVVTVRSVPFRTVQQYQEVKDKITVLYHGNIDRARGLHETVLSMPKWRQEFVLVIRGSGDREFIGYLQNLAEKLGVSGRISFEAPVPFDEIIPAANKADIGYFVQANISRQKTYTLPNKFFEYIMAGLALCVSNLPEMARLTARYNLGKLVDNCTADDIAGTINSFTRESIGQYKRASLIAAGELNWENEKIIMLRAYDEIL